MGDHHEWFDASKDDARKQVISNSYVDTLGEGKRPDVNSVVIPCNLATLATRR